MVHVFLLLLGLLCEIVWNCSCTIEGWWRFRPPPPLHFSFSYFVRKQLGFFFLQKLSLQQPTGMRAALQIADGSPASRVRAKRCDCFGDVSTGVGWGDGYYMINTQRHVSMHKCTNTHICMTWSNTGTYVLSSFRLSVLLPCNHDDLRSHTHTSSSLTVSQIHIDTVVTNHPSGTAIPRSGWQSIHAHKYRLMPFSTKGLGCNQTGIVVVVGGLWPGSDKHGQGRKQVTSQIRLMYLGLQLVATWGWQVCTCTWFQ